MTEQEDKKKLEQDDNYILEHPNIKIVYGINNKKEYFESDTIFNYLEHKNKIILELRRELEEYKQKYKDLDKLCAETLKENKELKKDVDDWEKLALNRWKIISNLQKQLSDLQEGITRVEEQLKDSEANDWIFTLDDFNYLMKKKDLGGFENNGISR